MELTDEQVKAWKQAFELAGVDVETMGECLLKIAKAMVITCIEIGKAMQQVANIIRKSLPEAIRELEELEALEKKAILDSTTARDRKKARERRQAVEQANAARFRQYRTRETARAVKKRTGPRGREWRGPYREG